MIAIIIVLALTSAWWYGGFFGLIATVFGAQVAVGGAQKAYNASAELEKRRERRRPLKKLGPDEPGEEGFIPGLKAPRVGCDGTGKPMGKGRPRLRLTLAYPLGPELPEDWAPEAPKPEAHPAPPLSYREKLQQEITALEHRIDQCRSLLNQHT